jgi:general secretion pathway protein G
MPPIPLEYAGPRRTSSVRPLPRTVTILITFVIVCATMSALWPRSPAPSLDSVAGAGAAHVWAALRNFHSDHRRMPTHQEGLNALLKPPTWPRNSAHPYLPRLPTDPWGRPFVYLGIPSAQPSPQRSFVLSLGPDGQEGTADDLVFAH